MLPTRTLGTIASHSVVGDTHLSDCRLGRLNSDGASNLTELHLLLQDSVMIRRLKSEVLTQLPPKRRTEVKLSLDTVTSAKIKQVCVGRLLNADITFFEMQSRPDVLF